MLVSGKDEAHDSPDQRSPEKIPASPPAPPSSEQGTPNSSQRLDYQQCPNWDECYHDFIDGSRYGAGECSTRAGRIRGSHTDMLWVSGLVGGDEPLFFGRKDIEFTSRETEILDEEFSRNPLIARKALLMPLQIPGAVAPETAEHELSLISSTPEELLSTPVSSRSSNKSDENTTIGTKEKRILDNIRPDTSMGNEKTKHFRKIWFNGKICRK